MERLEDDAIRAFAEEHGWRPRPGREGQLSPVAFALWARRCEIENGWRVPAAVDAADLPDQVPDFVRVYWQGFLLLLGCRWLDERYRGRPAPFTHDWASAWCGLTLEECKAARIHLKKLGALIEASEKARYAKRWLPWRRS